MNNMKTAVDETFFWYSKASQRLVTEIELRTLTRSSVDVMEEMIRDMQIPVRPGIPVHQITTLEEGKR